MVHDGIAAVVGNKGVDAIICGQLFEELQAASLRSEHQRGPEHAGIRNAKKSLKLNSGTDHTLLQHFGRWDLWCTPRPAEPSW